MKVIGRGGYGKILLVEKISTGEPYAMKVIKKHEVLEKSSIAQLKRECDILQKVDHPFLLGMKHYFQDEQRIYFIMPYVRGGNLFNQSMSGPFNEERAKFYIIQLVMALGHLH